MGKIARTLTIAGAVLGLALVAPAAPALAASSTSTGVVNPTKEQPWYQQYQATPLSATIDIN
jgi:ABC-type sugar transport system substrate-binding protein